MKILKNVELNGVEVYFDERPAKEVTELLKSYNFRFNRTKKCWYARVNKFTNLILDELRLAVNNTEEEATYIPPFNFENDNSESDLVEISDYVNTESVEPILNISKCIEERLSNYKSNKYKLFADTSFNNNSDTIQDKIRKLVDIASELLIYLDKRKTVPI